MFFKPPGVINYFTTKLGVAIVGAVNNNMVSTLSYISSIFYK